MTDIEERVTALEISLEMIQRALENVVQAFQEVERRLTALEAK